MSFGFHWPDSHCGRYIIPYGDQFDFDVGEADWPGTIDAIPLPARHLLATHWLKSEVCNGGFFQFFWNSTGLVLPEALAGFTAIGLPEVAELCAKATHFFAEPYPRCWEVRRSRLDPLGQGWPFGVPRKDWDPFGEIDTRFYEALKGERYEQMADRYALSVTGEV